MRRRQFITIIGGVAAAWPLGARAQLPHKRPVLVYLSGTTRARGAPFTAQGLGSFFKKQCRLAGLANCSIHGLRKAAVTRLVNAGCSNDQIKAITGHRSDSAIAPYKRGGDQRLLARQAMNMQLRSEGERDLSSLRSPIVQPRAK